MKLLCILIIMFASNHSYADEEFLNKVHTISARMQKSSENMSKLKGLIARRKFYNECSSDPSTHNICAQLVRDHYSFLGDYHSVLQFDSTDDSEESMPKFNDINLIPAAKHITEQAASYQAVIINEAHHIAKHRALTYSLLESLYDQGYRYFAAEAFTSEISNLNSLVKEKHGYYVVEPIFTNLVYRALEIGYELIPYDYSSSKEHSNLKRDELAAKRIQTQVYDRDKDAKVLIHVGYGHNTYQEDRLAYILNKKHKKKILTIDQTKIDERFKEELQHPLYNLMSNSKEASIEPFIVQLDSEPFSYDTRDLSVFWPKSEYKLQRPEWARLYRSEKYLNSEICGRTIPCLVQILPSLDEGINPLDSFIVRNHDDFRMFLDKNGKYLVAEGLDGKRVTEIRISELNDRLSSPR